MTPAGRTVAIIVAAGRGERAGGGVPKQFRMLAGQPVIARAVGPFVTHPRIDSIILVVGEGQQDMTQAALEAMTSPPPPCPPSIVTGGATRRQSVLAGLFHVAETGGAARVLIHDAARPLLPAAVIDRLLIALDEARGAVPVLPVVDTLARGDGALGSALGEIVDRDSLYRVQTPQAFAFDAVWEAHRTWSGAQEPTDDAQMLRARGHDVTLVDGDRALEKLTMAEDFDAAALRLGAAALPRTGMGYDVHRLVAGEDLWLCGVQVPHDRGLSGHSDADVALHALVDALLGALADGDIGSHFPPSDPQWRGAASSRFVTYARDLVEQRGGAIIHVDVTIICEAPKIGPHRDAMRARVAALLDISPARVSIKATTTERLGFAGRGEGIAAQAVATITLPDLF
ncbi:bifunctional 2-C-methyl-D-erythritol 4-phosphate cytidylyltransferase/2-C-methyl-D-erythritol 2,4-cyclodiphosphate synthase [Sphingobium aquiterrae]|uniref:bifunctional 2-C-methyl-D-erythritol 4-phosphate cytidylyltransferase/2-C-methyl-D-erythritol 2,4-cyclodiphosphate synthase n=1 Tax=Sphingobium aquiterrae TaxID=2038656 RepID=UPI00301AA4AA